MNPHSTPLSVFGNQLFASKPKLLIRSLLLLLLACCARLSSVSAENALPGDTLITATICGNETYPFNGELLNLSGEYVATYIASDGSDSTVTLQLTVLPLLFENLNVSICQGESYPFFGQLLTVSGAYEGVLTGSNGCDSTVLLNLSVLPHSFTNLSAGICTGTSYIFQEDTLTESGTYLAILTAENGCDSLVELHLSVVDSFDVRINAVICNGESYAFGGEFLSTTGIYVDSLVAIGGCDSIITLNLHVLPTQQVTLPVSICEGAQYVFQGDTLTTAGDYTYVSSDINGCDSITVLQLETVSFYETALEATICDHDTYAFGGEQLNTEGVYVDTLTAVGGCDSILTLTLHVLPGSATQLDATVCDGDSLEYNGVWYSQPGDYTFTFEAANGCDSVVTFTLNVLDVPNTILEAVVCAGEPFIFYGEQLTESGVYEAFFQAENGCDSVVSLVLTVLPELTSSFQVSICAGGSYEYNGETFTQGGSYNFLLQSALGCDSSVTMNLIVLPLSQLTLNTAICEGEEYEFDGQLITESGIYSAVYTGANGCDSTVTLNLSVIPLLSSNVEAAICAGSTYPFNGIALTDAGVYTATLTGSNGCDSTVTLTLSVLPTYTTALEASICEGESYSFYGQLLTEPGNYEFNLTAENGCDSTISITISVLPLVYSAMEAQICQGETFVFDGDSLTTTGTYYFPFDGSNGCDSIMIVYLSVQPVYTTILDVSLCEGTTYNFNGITLSTAGSYIAEFNSVAGCDSSVVLNLSYVNTFETNLQVSICPDEIYVFDQDTLTAAGTYQFVYVSTGGCDSTVNLTLSILPLSSSTTEAAICAGESFSFNGQSFDLPGNYSVILTGSNGCDSTANLILTVHPVQNTAIAATVCANEGYPFAGALLTDSGVYTNTQQSQYGCDSIITLTLTVNPVVSSSQSAVICNGESYTFNGLILTESGVYTGVFSSSLGCDSVVTLTLEVLPIPSGSTTATTCDGAAYSFNGQSFNQSGVYTVVLNGAATNGCDSLDVLNLTVYQPINPLVVDAMICQGDTFNFQGQFFTEAGDYVFQYNTAAGCDSTVILGLSVSPLSETTINALICTGGSYVYNGTALTEAGEYTFHFQNQFGCDSTVVVDLTVEGLLPVTVTLQNGVLSAAAFANAYQWINCATNQAIAGANDDTFTPTVSGQYAVIVTSANGCTNVSDCVNVTVVGTKELFETSAWRLFPNPTSSYTTVQFAEATQQDLTLDLIDAGGRMIRSVTVPAGSKEMRLDLEAYPSGLYLIRMTGELGISTKIISKNQ